MKKPATTVLNPDYEKLWQRPEVILAIDPGLSGAAVTLYMGRLQAYRDFKKLEDIVTAVSALKRCPPAPTPTAVVLEGVHAMPSQGVCSMFNFGVAFGVAKGAVWSSICAPVTFVSPQEWQNWFKKRFDFGGGPFDSRHVAEILFRDQRAASRPTKARTSTTRPTRR